MKKLLPLFLLFISVGGTAHAANATGSRVYVFDAENATREIIVSGGRYIMRNIDSGTNQPAGNDITQQSLVWGNLGARLQMDFYTSNWTWISDSTMWDMDSDGDKFSDMAEALFGSDPFTASSIPSPFLGKNQVMKNGVMITLDAATPDLEGGNPGDDPGDDEPGDNPGDDTGDDPGDGGGGGDPGSGGKPPFPDFEDWYQDMVDKGVFPDTGVFEQTYAKIFYYLEKDAYDRAQVLQLEAKQQDLLEEQRELAREMAASVRMQTEQEYQAQLREEEEWNRANGNLSDIKTGVGDMQSSIDAGVAASSSLQNTAQSTNAILSDVETGIASVNDNLKAGEAIGSALQSAVSSGNATLNSIDSRVGAVNDNLADIEAVIKDAADVNDDNLENVVAAVNEVGEKLDVSGAIGTLMTETITSASNNATRIETSLGELQGQIAEGNLFQNTQLEGIEEAVITGNESIESALNNISDQSGANTERLIDSIENFNPNINVTVDTDTSGISNQLDTVIGQLGVIADNTAVDGNGQGIDLSGVEGLLSSISGKIDAGLGLMENLGDGNDDELEDSYEGYDGLDSWEKPEKNDLMKFDVDLAEAKSRLQTALKKVSIDFDSMKNYTPSRFTTQVKIPVGGTLQSTQWYTYNFSMDQFPAEVNSGIDSIRRTVVSVIKSIMVLLFGRKVWALIWGI